MPKDRIVGAVEKVQRNYVQVRILVGGVELVQRFPRDVMFKHSLLEQGRMFRYFPSRDGSVKYENVKPYKNKPLSEEFLLVGLGRLSNRGTLSDTTERIDLPAKGSGKHGGCGGAGLYLG